MNVLLQSAKELNLNFRTVPDDTHYCETLKQAYG
jgi:hypothetical protein